MRIILRPLLFLQSFFYLSLGSGGLSWAIIYGLERFDVWEGNELSYVAVSSIVAGTIIFFLGFLGLITACSKSYSWSYCYSIIILVFIIIQCLLAILTVLFRDYNYHSDGLYQSMVRAVWDSLHSGLECCGTLSPDDCSDSAGCVEVFSSWLTANFLLVTLVSAGLMAFQVLGVCLACCLARAVQVQHLAI